MENRPGSEAMETEREGERGVRALESLADWGLTGTCCDWAWDQPWAGNMGQYMVLALLGSSTVKLQHQTSPPQSGLLDLCCCLA